MHALETTGTQEYVLESGELLERCAVSYGRDAADELGKHVG